MFKTIASSMIVIGIVACGAFAGAEQEQLTGIQGINLIQLAQGEQVGESLQNLVVDNQQSIVGAAGQGFFGAIGQALGAMGECGLVAATQNLGVLGGQWQNIGDCISPKLQGSSLDMTAMQELGRANGAGAASALHTIVLNGGQTGANAIGSLNEATTVMGMQTSDLAGQPGSAGSIATGMTVVGQQIQGSGAMQ